MWWFAFIGAAVLETLAIAKIGVCIAVKVTLRSRSSETHLSDAVVGVD